MMELLLSTALASGADVDPSDRDVLGVLAEGYSRNLESFSVIDCRFDYVAGMAATVDDALAGRWTEKRVPKHGHWLVSGMNVRYELLCEAALRDEVELIKKEAQGTEAPRGGGPHRDIHLIQVPCVDDICLRNSSYTLTYGPGNLAGNLFSKTDLGGYGIEVTPFNPDHYGADQESCPSIYLRGALAGRCKLKFEGTKRINGADTLVVQVGPDLDRTFAFDPARGYVLAYSSFTSEKSGKRYYEAYVTDARECSRSRWFPMRVVTISSPDSAPPFQVKELSVVQLDVDTEPEQERLRLELPVGVQIVNIGRLDQVTLRSPETIGIDDLAALDERCRKRGEEYRAMLEKAEADGDNSALDQSRGRALLLIACLVLAVTTTCFVVLNRRR